MDLNCIKFYERKSLPLKLMKSKDQNKCGNKRGSQKSSVSSIEMDKYSDPCDLEMPKDSGTRNTRISYNCDKDDDDELEEFCRAMKPTCKPPRNVPYNECSSVTRDAIRDDLDEQSLEELCDWLIKEYRNITHNDDEEDSCCGDDSLRTKIRAKLRQLLCLRNEFDRKKSPRPSGSVKFKDVEFACSCLKDRSNRRCSEISNRTKSNQYKHTKVADVIKVYDEAMERVNNAPNRRNFIGRPSCLKVKENNQRKKSNFCCDIGTPKICKPSPYEKCSQRAKPSFRGNTHLEGVDVDSCLRGIRPCSTPASKDPCSNARSNARRTSQLSKLCKPLYGVPKKPKNCRPTRKSPTKKCQLADDLCSSAGSRGTRDLLDDCEDILNERDKQSDICRSIFEDDDEMVCNQFDQDTRQEEPFYECLRRKLDGKPPTKRSATSGIQRRNVEAICSQFSLNSSCSNGNLLPGNNSAANNNLSLVDNDNKFNSLGFKLYSAIREKFNRSFNIWNAVGEVQGEIDELQEVASYREEEVTPLLSNGGEDETPTNVSGKVNHQTGCDDKNNSDDDNEEVPLDCQLNNSSNNHHCSTPQRDQQRQTTTTTTTATTTTTTAAAATTTQSDRPMEPTKCDWRSKIEYWDVTLADVREVQPSTPSEETPSTLTCESIKRWEEVPANQERRECAAAANERNSLAYGKIRQFYLGEFPANAIKSSTIKIIVNSNANAGRKEARGTYKYRPQNDEHLGRPKASNNSNCRPPWRPINTSVPRTKRVPMPPPLPVQQNFLVNDRLPVRNEPLADALQWPMPKFEVAEDASNSYCRYCCRHDCNCCCQQFVMQLQLQQHCRHMEDMLDRKQEELRAELRRLQECSSAKKGNEACPDACCVICSDDCNDGRYDDYDFVAKARRNGMAKKMRSKNESWWVDFGEKHKALLEMSSSSSSFSSSMCGIGPKKTPRVERPRPPEKEKHVNKLSSSSSKMETDIRRAHKGSQTLRDYCGQLTTGCQTLPEEDKSPPEEEKLSAKPSRAVQYDQLDVGNFVKGGKDDGVCQSAFRECMKTVGNQGDDLEKWTEIQVLAKPPQGILGDWPQGGQRMANVNGTEYMEKFRDLRSIISAFRKRSNKSKKQFLDLKTICKEAQMFGACPQSRGAGATGFSDLSNICGDLQGADDLSDLAAFLRGSPSGEDERRGGGGGGRRMGKEGQRYPASDDCCPPQSCGDRKRRSWSRREQDASSKSTELVHRWMERCLKQKLTNSEKLFGSLRPACGEAGRASHGCSPKVPDEYNASCDDANWECQVMVDDSHSLASRKEQIRKQIFGAIESYCREFGSLGSAWEGPSPGQREEEKQKRPREPKKSCCSCRCHDKKSSLKSDRKCRENKKKVKLSLENVAKVSCPRANRWRSCDRRRSDSSEAREICRSTSTSTCRQTRGRSRSDVSATQSDDDDDDDKMAEMRRRGACAPRERRCGCCGCCSCCGCCGCCSCCGCCGASSRASSKSVSLVDVYGKLKKIRHCRGKKSRTNKCQSNRRACLPDNSTLREGADSPQRWRQRQREKDKQTDGEAIRSSPIDSRSSSKKTPSTSVQECSKFVRAPADCSSTSRESVLSCLHEILTTRKKRLERQIKDECREWDVKRSCQLERLERCL